MGMTMTDKLVATRVLGIPITIKYTNEEELGQGSMFLLVFTMAMFLPVTLILNHQYDMISSALFTKPLPIPSFFFYFATWLLDSLLGTGFLVLLFIAQLVVVFLTYV
jgi:hypothetical protein